MRLTEENLRQESKGNVGKILPIRAYTFQLKLRVRRPSKATFWPRTAGRTKKAHLPDLRKFEEALRVIAVEVMNITHGAEPEPGSDLERRVGANLAQKYRTLKEKLAAIIRKKILTEPSSVPAGVTHQVSAGGVSCTFIATWALIRWQHDQGWPLNPSETSGFLDYYALRTSGRASRDVVIAAIYQFGRSYPGYGPLCQVAPVPVTQVWLQKRYGLSRQNLRTILKRYPRRQEYPIPGDTST